MSTRFVGTCVLIMAAAGCAETPSASVRLAMTNSSARARTSGPAAAAPSELGVKITTAYVAEDQDASGTNVGVTQAVYASPNCATFSSGDSGTNVDPDLGACGLDVGLESSAGKLITGGPDYIDLAAGQMAVDAALDAGRFAVDVGTYKYLRLDIGSNSFEAPPNGTQATLPAGTAMNYRFRAGAMTAAFEVRHLMGIDVTFDPPLVLTESMSVRVELDYDIESAVYTRPAGEHGGNYCAPAVGDTQYCLEPSSINFVPSIVVEQTP